MVEILLVDVFVEIIVFKLKKNLDLLFIVFFNINFVFDRNMSLKIFFIVWFFNIFVLCLGNIFEEIID